MDAERPMRIVRSILLGTAALLLMTGVAYAGALQTAALDGTLAAAKSASKADAVAMAPMALNSLTNPPAKIATAPVADQNGTVVGAVQKVILDAAGKPVHLDIALLGSGRVVALDSGRLSYDMTNNVVTAALDKSQLAQLPAVPEG